MVGRSMKLSSLFRIKRPPKLPRLCQFLPYCAQASTLSFHKADQVNEPTTTTFGFDQFITSPTFLLSDESPDLINYCNSDDSEYGLETLVRGVVKSSDRLFFEPSSKMSLLTMMPENKGMSMANDSEIKYQSERKRKGKEKVDGGGGEVAEVSLRESSVLLALDSNDPYEDFKKSMEEMMELHGLNNCERLEELLHCYLAVNDEKDHDFILNAFFDLLSIET